VIDVFETTVKDDAATPPKVTAVAAVKPEPVMVTEVPPAVLPEVVPRLLTTGAAAAVKVNRAGVEAPGTLTTTPTVPAVSVIGDASGFPITEQFLAAMEARWFGLRDGT
jgi:hypothetical protein